MGEEGKGWTMHGMDKHTISRINRYHPGQTCLQLEREKICNDVILEY
jgi:hypothetical protein